MIEFLVGIYKCVRFLVFILKGVGMKKVLGSLILAIGLIFLSIGLYFAQLDAIKDILERVILH